MPPKRATEDGDAVVSEIEILAPPSRVFQSLTDSKQLMTWWGAEPTVDLRTFEMDARVGGRWRFECTDRAGNPVNGVTEFVAHGVIVRFDPPRFLAYTWIANWHDEPTQETLVSWELKRTRRGTRVRVTHSGLANQDVARKDYRSGWSGVLQLLKTYLSK